MIGWQLSYHVVMVKVMVWMHLSTMLRLVAAGARLPAIDEMYSTPGFSLGMRHRLTRTSTSFSPHLCHSSSIDSYESVRKVSRFRIRFGSVSHGGAIRSRSGAASDTKIVAIGA